MLHIPHLSLSLLYRNHFICNILCHEYSFSISISNCIFRRKITKNYCWGLNDSARNANILADESRRPVVNTRFFLYARKMTAVYYYKHFLRYAYFIICSRSLAYFAGNFLKRTLSRESPPLASFCIKRSEHFDSFCSSISGQLSKLHGWIGSTRG